MIFICLLVPILLVSSTDTDYSQTNQQVIAGSISNNFTITNYESLMWLGSVSIGSPAQVFPVQVDTGSNILWVPESYCKFCPIKDRYNTQNQPDFKPNGSTYYQAYGSGECSGYVAQDLVGFAGTPISTQFMMMFATHETGFAFPDAMSGIMGLSNNQSFINIFQASFQANQISTELYGIVLNPLPLESYVLYGTIDPALLDEAIWVIPDDIYRWKLQVNEFLINGVDYSAAMATTTSGILDTGTSCLSVTVGLYEALLEDFLYPSGCQMDQGQVYCPCTEPATGTYPNITIVFNQATVTMPWMNLFENYYTADSTGYCAVCLQYMEGAPFMVFGDPVLMSFVPIFNKTANLVGFVGAEQNDYPNGDYPGNDEIDEDYIE